MLVQTFHVAQDAVVPRVPALLESTRPHQTFPLRPSPPDASDEPTGAMSVPKTAEVPATFTGGLRRQNVAVRVAPSSTSSVKSTVGQGRVVKWVVDVRRLTGA